MGLSEQVIAGNPMWAWAVAGAVAVTSSALLLLIRRLLRGRAVHPDPAAGSRAAVVLQLVQATRAPIIIVVSVYLGMQVLAVPPIVGPIAGLVALVAVLLQAAVWGGSTIDFWVARVRSAEDATSTTTAGAVGALARLVLWAGIGLVLLDGVGVNVSAILAGVGIGGIAIALAAQNILSDLFSSLSIVVDKPFLVGDFIIVGDSMGTVEHIGLKTTRVRSLSGEQIVLSNADILQSRVRNYKRMEQRRVLFTLDVTYQAAAEQIEALSSELRKIVEAEPNARFDRAHFARYADSALQFEVVYYVASPDYNEYMDIQERINLAIFRHCAEQHIDFAYPTRTVYVQTAAGPDDVTTAGR